MSNLSLIKTNQMKSPKKKILMITHNLKETLDKKKEFNIRRLRLKVQIYQIAIKCKEYN